MSAYLEYLNSYMSNLNVYLVVVAVLGLLITLSAINYHLKVIRQRKTLNLNGPPVFTFLGTLPYTLTTSREILDTKWAKQYGLVYVLFDGTTPRIVFNDLDIVKRICIEDFDNFPNHYRSNVLLFDYTKNFIFYAQDDQWKQLKALMSPTFTSSKIRQMFGSIDKCADEFLDVIDAKIDALCKANKNTQVELVTNDIFYNYTVDSIASCCYALKLNRNNSSASQAKIIHSVQNFFTIDTIRTYLVLILPTFLASLMYKGKVYDAIKQIADRLENTLKKRASEPGKHKDFLQLLVDAKLGDELILDETDSYENHHANLRNDSIKLEQNKMLKDAEENRKNKLDNSKLSVQLTEIELLSNSILMLMVGSETTAGLMRNAVYCLSHHPQIQQNLYNELTKIASKSTNLRASFKYDDLVSCAYLDSVISETLRILIPVAVFDRHCKKDYFIKEYNICVPKGAIIEVAYHHIQRNPSYWPEPTKFDPSRFMPENRSKIIPGSYVPFGQGPRYCIGMRFSLAEAKIALAKLAMTYKFDKIPNSPWPPKPVFGSKVTRYHPSKVLISKR